MGAADEVRVYWLQMPTWEDVTMPNFAFFEDYDQITSPDRILYHGSRGGIIGEIMPRSRPGTDFGEGFYMGTDPMQTKGLVSNEPQPVSYALSVDFSGISRNQVLVLNRYEWIYTILHYRRTCRPFNGSAIDEAIAQLTKGFDFVMGPIADDRMNEAVRRFAANELTDEGLFACLSSVRYGTQVVAKTEAACRRIRIIVEQVMYEDELDGILAYQQEQRKQARGIVSRIQERYKGQGRYLSELLVEPYEPSAALPTDVNHSILTYS